MIITTTRSEHWTIMNILTLHRYIDTIICLYWYLPLSSRFDLVWHSDSGLPHPGKVLDFFCCPGKSLKVLEFCVLVLESPGKMFIKFSRDLPGQNVKFFFYRYLVIIQSHCWNNFYCKVCWRSLIVLLKIELICMLVHKKKKKSPS